jgi:hypothetical protein
VNWVLEISHGIRAGLLKRQYHKWVFKIQKKFEVLGTDLRKPSSSLAPRVSALGFQHKREAKVGFEPEGLNITLSENGHEFKGGRTGYKGHKITPPGKKG